MKLKLKKGKTSVPITIPDEKIIDMVIGKNVPEMNHEKIQQIISKGIKRHTPDNINLKKIAIIIPDNTRLWARGDIFIPQIVKTLFDLGSAKDSIKIIIALGTHDDMDKDQFSQLAGIFCAENIDILNSANKNQDRLVYIGETSRNTQLHITREVANADHIIIFGGILHHMAAGFGGGRKYILPGVAGYDSIQQNHSLAMNKNGTPHPCVRQAMLSGNPVNEDIQEAADLVLKNKTCTYVAIAANGAGDIFHADVGPLHDTFMKGCKELDQACCIHVPRKGDFALISAGGHRTDGQLYQSTKALFNAVDIVKEGGAILFVAGCSQGVGNQTFSSVLKNFKHDSTTIGKQLVETFNMPSYVAFRVIDVLNRFNVTLVSDLSKRETKALGFNFADNNDTYIKGLKGKGYILPFAENILPVFNPL